MASTRANDDPAARNFVPTSCHDTYDFINPRQWSAAQRRVLVTGASKGIGQAIAISYARAGYSHIALLARTSVSDTVARAKKAAGAGGHAPEFLQLCADLMSVESVDAAASQVARAFGCLDVLINNAGYLEEWTPIIQSDPDQWWKTWEVNVRGTYLMNRAFIPLLLQGEQKTTITVSSVGAWVTKSGASAYQGSKTAQVRFANHLMAEYGNQGLLAYTVHPGNVKTDLALGLPGYMHETLRDEPELAADAVVWMTAERRLWLADRYISCTWNMEELSASKDRMLSADLLKLSLSR